MLELKKLKFIDFKVGAVKDVEEGFGFDVRLIFPDGTDYIQHKSGYDSAEQAMDERDRVVGQLYAGKYIVYEDLSMKDFLTYWLEEVKRKTMTAASYDGYKNVVYNHLIPYFEGVNVSSIKMAHIRELYNEKAEYSHSVTRLIKTVMNTCMDYAKKNNLVSYNPARGVNLPKQIEKREYRKRTIDTAKTLNLEQILTLIRASEGTSIHMQILFAVLMGLRRGEINGLKYSDVDYINRTLTIKRQLGRAPNTNKSDIQARTYTKQEIPPKTRSSERILNIPDYVFEEILKERTKYEKNRNRRKKDFNDQDYICCSSYGHPRSMSFHFKPYKQLLKDCELPDIRWHDLRSTFCTLLLKNDYSPKAVSRMMGHAKEIITLDVYADNAQIIADGVQDMQGFIDDVLPDDGGIYKEHTDIAIDLEFLNEEESYEELSDVEISLEIVDGICENAV